MLPLLSLYSIQTNAAFFGYCCRCRRRHRRRFISMQFFISTYNTESCLLHDTTTTKNAYIASSERETDTPDRLNTLFFCFSCQCVIVCICKRMCVFVFCCRHRSVVLLSHIIWFAFFSLYFFFSHFLFNFCVLLIVQYKRIFFCISRFPNMYAVCVYVCLRMIMYRVSCAASSLHFIWVFFLFIWICT